MKIIHILFSMFLFCLSSKNMNASTHLFDHDIKQAKNRIVKQNEYAISTHSYPTLTTALEHENSIIWMISNQTHIPVYLFHFRDDISIGTIPTLFNHIITFDINAPDTIHTLVFKTRRREDAFSDEDEETLMEKNLTEKLHRCEEMLSELKSLASQITYVLHHTRHDRYLAIDQKNKKCLIYQPNLFE